MRLRDIIIENILNFVPASSSRDKKYWYNVYEKEAVVVPPMITHTEMVLQNQELFELDEECVSDRVLRDVEDSGYSSEIIYEMLKLGWVRVEYNNSELSIESSSEKNAHKTIKAIMSVISKPFGIIYLDIRTSISDNFHENSALTGARLDYFIDKGRIPSGMVRENKLTR